LASFSSPGKLRDRIEWKEIEMGYRVLAAEEASWRPSNQMGIMNTDLGRQLEADTLGARLWRLAPRQASTRHRHAQTTELYVLLEGIGRIRADGELLTLSPLSAVLVEPDTVRQVFNNTEHEQLWLIVSAPPEGGKLLEMSADERLAFIYPDGRSALPPELENASPAGSSAAG
jgi:quercetin dioxygenase-like cupin family protein